MRPVVIGAAFALLLAMPAAMAAGPATVEVPIKTQDLTAQGAGASVHLADGRAPLAIPQASGSLEVWTYTVPCLRQQEETCVPSSSEESTSRVDVTGGAVTIRPTEGEDSYEGHLVLGESTLFQLSAEDGHLAVNSHEGAHAFPEEGSRNTEGSIHDAPARFHVLELPEGPYLRLTGDNELETAGPYQLSVANATIIAIDRQGEEHRFVTGWSWQENSGSQFGYERQLRLVNLQLSSPLETAWDGTVHAYAPAPLSLSADQATLTLQEGELAGASAEDGQVTLEHLGLTVLDWSPGSHDEPATLRVQEGTPTPEAPPEDEALEGAALWSAGAGVLTAAALTAYYWPRLSWGATALVLPMYSRIAKDELLDNETREQLYETVKEEPGIHAHALAEAVEIGWGTTVYHLRRLERNGMVTSEKHGRYRRFFPSAGYLARTREVLSVLQNETTNDIARYVLKEPGTNQKGVCEALDISPSLANWHIKRLVEAGLVDKERRGRTVHYTPGPAWDEVGDAVDPVVS